MDKALEMGKSSATGSFHLLLGVAGSTIIMAVGIILLGMLLPQDQYGLYGIAMIPSSMINFFRDWGINSALTKQIASLRVDGRNDEIHDVIVSGVVFEIISGVVLTLVCFALAWPLALLLSPENVGELSVYISVMSLSVFAGAIAAAAAGIFVGFERMRLNSFTQVFQAIIKASLGPFLIILGFGALGAIYAAMLSILAGGIVAILIVYFALFRPLRKCKTGKCDIKTTLRPMLQYGLPLTFSSIVIGVLPLIFTTTMTVYAGTTMMSNYFIAANFAVLLTFVSIPIATALFPVFSKFDPENEPGLAKTVFASSVKYTAIFLVPATLLLITLATPLVNTLFPKDGILQSLFVVDAEPKFPYAPLFLVLSCIVYLFVLVGNISLGTFQTGIGQTKQIMKQSALSLAFGLPLAYFLVSYFASIGGPLYAVIGGLIGSLIASMPGMIWGLVWIWKKYHVKADFGVSGKVFFASVLASIATFLIVGFLSVPDIVVLVAGFFVFLFIYLAAAPLLGAINQVDIENFRAMFSGLGVVSKILSLPLLFMQKMCKQNVEKKILSEKPESYHNT